MPSAAHSTRASPGRTSRPRETQLGITTWCRGWNASANSLGRTSTPHVSVAIAAISVVDPVAVPKESPAPTRRRNAPPLPTTTRELTGPDQDDVTAADGGRRTLRGDGGLEVLVVIAKPSGSSPPPMTRATSSRTPRPVMRPATCSMPVTLSPVTETVSRAMRPFHAGRGRRYGPARPSEWRTGAA